MFKETKQTHSQNDHNSFISSALEEFENGCNIYNISDPPSDKEWLKSFLRTKLNELLDATEGYVPKEKPFVDGVIPNAADYGFNSCRSQFLQNIKRLRG